MKIAFFDAKPYDIEAFEEPAKNAGIKLKFYETKLNPDTDVFNGSHPSPLMRLPLL